MLSEGVSDRARARRRATSTAIASAACCAARRGARLAAITSGGAIPDNNNYAVVQWPEETQGRHGRRGLRDRELGRRHLPARQHVVADPAHRGGRACSSRTRAASRRRSRSGSARRRRARASCPTRSATCAARSTRGSATRRRATRSPRGSRPRRAMPLRAAQQLVAYLAAARAALGALPRKDLIVAERFFDEAGGMQLVLHAPLGGRINRAWGLALRKKFCVTFDFELQAAATDDGIVISLGQPHSFPLDTVFGFVPSHQARRDARSRRCSIAPMFEIRWRWNVTRSLTVLRRSGGKRVPPHLIKMRAADTLSVVFPQAQACGENIVGAARGAGSSARVRDDPRLPRRGDGRRGPARRCSSSSSAARSSVIARDTVEPSAAVARAASTRTRTRSSTTRRSRSAARARCSCAAACRAEHGRRRRRRARRGGDRARPPRRSRRRCAMPTSCTTRCSRCGSCPSRSARRSRPAPRDWFDALAATGRACRAALGGRGRSTCTRRGSRPSGSARRARCSARRRVRRR